MRSAISEFLTSRPVAAVVTLATVAVLLVAATGLRDTRLGLRLGSGLPEDSQVQQAASAAAQGFAPGVLAPTVVLVEGEDVADRGDELVRLEDAVREVPGVAGTLGPRTIPPEVGGEVMVSEDGNAARLAVILDDSPLDSRAIETVNRLDDGLPELLRESGLEEQEASLAGQTAIAADTVEGIVESSVLVGAVVLALNVLLLAFFLRAIVAPLYLVAASVLSVAATLGLTTYFFQGFLDHSDLTYYVPFAAGVLLVSLGSDYNVFVAGRIWQEAGRRPLREAIAVAAPGASRAIGGGGARPRALVRDARPRADRRVSRVRVRDGGRGDAGDLPRPAAAHSRTRIPVRGRRRLAEPKFRRPPIGASCPGVRRRWIAVTKSPDTPALLFFTTSARARPGEWRACSRNWRARSGAGCTCFRWTPIRPVS